MGLKNRLRKLEGLTGQDKITGSVLILFSGKDNIDEELKKYKRQPGDTPLSKVIIWAHEEMAKLKNIQNQTNLNDFEGENGRNETE